MYCHHITPIIYKIPQLTILPFLWCFERGYIKIEVVKTYWLEFYFIILPTYNFYIVTLINVIIPKPFGHGIRFHQINTIHLHKKWPKSYLITFPIRYLTQYWYHITVLFNTTVFNSVLHGIFISTRYHHCLWVHLYRHLYTHHFFPHPQMGGGHLKI